MSLAKDIFLLTRKFPDHEKYGLASQINRSAVSIPSNIAEGSGRGSNKQFSQFLGFALGSCFEIETQIDLAHSFEYVNTGQLKEITEQIQQIQKMIAGFNKTLR